MQASRIERFPSRDSGSRQSIPWDGSGHSRGDWCWTCQDRACASVFQIHWGTRAGTLREAALAPNELATGAVPWLSQWNGSSEGPCVVLLMYYIYYDHLCSIYKPVNSKNRLFPFAGRKPNLSLYYLTLPNMSQRRRKLHHPPALPSSRRIFYFELGTPAEYPTYQYHSRVPTSKSFNTCAASQLKQLIMWAHSSHT